MPESEKPKTVRHISDVLVDDGVPNGVYSSVESADHHARRRLSPTVLSAGFVDHRDVDAAAIKYSFEQKREVSAQTQDRMDRGTLAHLALLQPEKLGTHVAVWKGERRSGGSWEEFRAENGGKLIVPQESYLMVMDAVRQFRFNKDINELLSDGEAEVEMLTKEGRIFCSGQVDFVKRDGSKIVDLKTTDSGLDEKALDYTTRDFHYREKMALYRRWYERECGVEVQQCWNVFLRLKPPVGIVARKFTSQSLDWGSSRMLAALMAVDECLDRGFPIFFRSSISDVAELEMDDIDMETLE
jgi:hypothetical protein